MKTYLEFKDDEFEYFWEIEVNGNSHTIRYGEIGAKGQERTNNFESAEKAQKETDKLIKFRKKRGYKEAIAPTELELKQRKAKASFWSNSLSELLNATLYANRSYRSKYPNRYDLFQLLEKISLFGFDNMQQKIVKDNENHIEKINYFIDDKLILCISNLNFNQHYPRIYFYWEHGTIWNSYYQDEEPERRLKLFLDKFGQFYIENFEKITAEEKKWTEEYFIELENEKKLKKVKEEKITKIAENSIKLIVKTLMNKKAYPYVLEEKATSALLRIKASESRFLEFDLPHKTFVERINKVIPTFELVKENFHKDNIFGNFVIDRKATGQKCNEKKVYGIDSMYFDENDITDEFWCKHCKEYCEKTLLDGEKSSNWHSHEFYEELANCDFPKLQKKVILEDRGVKHIKIQYYFNDKYLFEINSGLSFRYFDDYWMDNDLRFGAKSSANEWHRFLEGFADFYLEYSAKINDEIKTKKEEYKLDVLRCNNFRIAIQEILSKTNYGYEIFAYKDVGIVYLYMPSVPETVLNMQFEYKNFQNELAKILPTLTLVEETLVNTELPFKFFNTQECEYQNIQWKVDG